MLMDHTYKDNLNVILCMEKENNILAMVTYLLDSSKTAVNMELEN